MGQAALAEPPVVVEPPPRPSLPRPKVAAESPASSVQPLFLSLIPAEPVSLVKTRSFTLGVSMGFHSLLIAAVLLVPILFSDALPPVARDALRVILVEPPALVSPAPPPPPPAAGLRAVPRAIATPAPPPADTKLVAPIEVPEAITPEALSFDLGVEGGVPGGVEGGVPGGVVGGIVGGLPQAPLPPPDEAPVVRIGGKLKPPKLVKQVRPAYPELARAARISALVILEARVDAEGYVKSVTVLRGQTLFDEPAVEAVKQWRYQPLLFNGVPTGFILTVTLSFHIANATVE